MKTVQDVQAANEIIHSTGEAALKQAIKASQQLQQGFAAMMDTSAVCYFVGGAAAGAQNGA